MGLYHYDTFIAPEPVNDRDIELVVGKDQHERRRSLPRRLIRITLTVAAVLALINAYVAPISFMPSIRQPNTDSAVAFDHPGEEDGHEFETGEVVKCWTKDDTKPIETHGHPHDDKLEHAIFPEITLDSDDIFFFARTQRDHHDHHERRFTSGSIIFETSDEQDEVTVSAVVTYQHWIYSQVCLYKRENGGLGVGVIVPPHEHHEPEDPEEPPHHPHHPHHPPPRRYRPHNGYHLVVTLPAKSDKVFNINSLETSLPIYTHHIADIGDKVLFNSLVLRSSNSPIHSESLTAISADVRTSNSPIEGSFNGTDSLKISTVNAPISVQVAFTTTKKDDDEEPAELVLSTANAKLEANIDLLASGDAKAGTFKVLTRTVNAPLTVSFTSAPVDSQLIYTGKTANAPAELVLHPTYEGTLEAQTAWFKANLVTRDDVEDPSGKGREREVEVSNVGRNGFKGDVHWGEKGDDTPKGSVSLHTSLGPVSITL